MRSRRETRGAWFPGWFWPSFATPASVWLLAFFVLPFYVILSVAFGEVDPIFLTAVPRYNPLAWDFSAFRGVVGDLFASGSIYQHAFGNTFLYVAVATLLCLVVGYPVAYFIARHAGRYKPIFLIAFIAPFWISYMMRMLAWVNLLSDDGLVNRVITLGGRLPTDVAWLSGQPVTVVLGLVYGYVPYMILPMFAALDRISPALIEAARDLGAGRVETFRRVVLPMSVPGVAAGLVLVALPMTGDYFTNDLLSGSPRTAMLGNLVNSAVGNPAQAGQAGALVLLLVVALTVPMIMYVRSVRRDGGVAS